MRVYTVSVARLSSRGPTRLFARRSLHNIAAETEHARESALCCCSEKRGGSATGYSSLVSPYPFPSNPRFSSPIEVLDEPQPRPAGAQQARQRRLAPVMKRSSKDDMRARRDADGRGIDRHPDVSGRLSRAEC